MGQCVSDSRITSERFEIEKQVIFSSSYIISLNQQWIQLSHRRTKAKRWRDTCNKEEKEISEKDWGLLTIPSQQTQFSIEN
ncbi:UNKNOWN [Stylonychia lemnae]|uniref:Uncharacterized protein n=1 Tax=Stylonychia lemnae TaxID=5949 RepID=A0A077ZQJ7_STYLE|nr:UNKNOWN [Stylonychia lemnae]|eukprot:CDW71660.1 UNKNOWN [Stylonychia lemnae]